MAYGRLGLALALGLVQGCAHTPPLKVAGTRPAPPAFHEFCATDPSQCTRTGPMASYMVLTSERRQELETINRQVNASIADVPDREQFGIDDVWSIPANGKGDCEDFALLKRKLLIQRGWPSSTLLLTVIADSSREGHAVLTAVTDQGDYVLDNRTASVRLYSATGYTFYKRQSQHNPRAWTALIPTQSFIAESF